MDVTKNEEQAEEKSLHNHSIMLSSLPVRVGVQSACFDSFEFIHSK